MPNNAGRREVGLSARLLGAGVSDVSALLTFEGRGEWRAWLDSHHGREPEARVVIFKSGPHKGRLTLREAQEEAVCFGWVDAINRRIDDSRYWLRFVPRKPGSAWSLSNIRRVERMQGADLMARAGLDAVAEARRNGQWDLALRVERTDLIPPDLESELRAASGALEVYENLAHSRKKQMLRSILSAKSPATAQRRIRAVVEEVGRSAG
jgi:uncharacterized protein YdeI (YjbR/CyaY-like superfamily)